MSNEAGPPFVSLAGGFFSGRVMSELRESAEQTWYQIQSVDSGALGTGATIGASQTSQATGYQVQAAITLFSTVTPAVTGNGNTPTAAAVLPQTSRPEPLAGLLLYISNTGANPINLYPHPSDPSNSINGLGLNVPIILGTNTITALQAITPGVWQADGVGEGFMGSIATTVSQGSITAAGASQGAATPITQAMFTTASTANGLILPNAQAGLQIVGNFTGSAGTVNVYPATGQTINALGANNPLAVTTPSTTPTVFYCFTAGQWWTK